MLDLRPYQEEAVSNIKKTFFEKGINKQVIVLATGLGKTVIFSHLISDIIKMTGSKKKALVIAHREELLTQAKDKIERVDPDLTVGIEQGINSISETGLFNGETNVVVASVPTIGRAESSRIMKFNPDDFCVIVTDEAHHASNDTYKRIFEHFGVLKDQKDLNKNILLLGVTATPSRNDNKGIDQIFEEVTFNYGIVEGIQDGWLSRIRAFRINTATDLSQVKTTAGDFNVGELGETVNNEERNKLVVKTYLEKTPNKQALCFAVDVAHTEELCNEFLKNGINASFVVGSTDKEIRKQRLQDFYDKKIQVMVNAMVLTEGYDNENIEVILMARPTKSGILFQQMIGRGTRLAPNKDFLTVIDFVDNTYKQSLKTTASLLGLEGYLDFKGYDILEVKEKVDELLDLAPGVNINDIDITKIDYMIEEVDLLSGLEVPNEISTATHYDWHKFGDGIYRIGLGNHNYIAINKTLTGQCEVIDAKYDPIQTKMHIQKIDAFPDIQTAIEEADKYIRTNYFESLKLVDNNASWRKQDPSQPQLDLLKKMGVNDTVLQHANKGQASRLITKLLNYSKRDRKKFLVQKGQIKKEQQLTAF